MTVGVPFSTTVKLTMVHDCPPFVLYSTDWTLLPFLFVSTVIVSWSPVEGAAKVEVHNFSIDGWAPRWSAKGTRKKRAAARILMPEVVRELSMSVLSTYA